MLSSRAREAPFEEAAHSLGQPEEDGEHDAQKAPLRQNGHFVVQRVTLFRHGENHGCDEVADGWYVSLALRDNTCQLTVPDTIGLHCQPTDSTPNPWTMTITHHNHRSSDVDGRPLGNVHR